MKSIVFFNNKGGVGKTTLCANVAAHFALAGRRTVLIDCDPQCNSTLLTLGDEFFENAFGFGSGGHAPKTILDQVQPISDGEPDPNTNVHVSPAKGNRFNVAILAGHPRLSLIEDKLSYAWSTLNSGEIGGFRTSNWFYKVCQALAPRFDVALVDVGPSLGSLNRSILIGADYFVTPMGCDIFSLMGIRNISDWLNDWIELYESGVSQSRKKHGDRMQEFAILEKPKISNGFAGYTVQQYITKSRQGVRRPTVAYETILTNIEPEIRKNLRKYYVSDKRNFVIKLGDVPNMYSLIPLAQSVNAPIHALESRDGLVGSQFRQAEEYGAIIGKVAKNLASNVGL